jgi:hypothetical protein
MPIWEHLNQCAASGVGRGSALRNCLLFLEAGPHSLEVYHNAGPRALRAALILDRVRNWLPCSRDARKGQYGSRRNSRVVLDKEAKGTKEKRRFSDHHDMNDWISISRYA